MDGVGVDWEHAAIDDTMFTFTTFLGSVYTIQGLRIFDWITSQVKQSIRDG